MTRPASFVLLALACSVAGAFAARADAAVARQGQIVMGTVLTVTVVADDAAKAAKLAADAIGEARRWDDALTIWRPEGELARLNSSAGRGDIPVGPRLEVGLVAMLRLARETGGAFEPAVGRLPDTGASRPGLAGIRQVLALKNHRARLQAGAVLDPGAIGKGLALDAMVDGLRRGGATAAFLDFGGSSQTAIGPAPGDVSGWSVLVSGLGDGVFHGTVRLRDASLSTSRAGAVDTKPILDPRSGGPVPAPRLVTVRAADATSADAWSTAMVVLGRDGLAAARAAGLEVWIEDGQGTRNTPGFGLLPGSAGAAGK